RGRGLHYIYLRVGSRFNSATDIVPDVVERRTGKIEEAAAESQTGAFNCYTACLDNSLHPALSRSPTAGCWTILFSAKGDGELRRLTTSSRCQPLLEEGVQLAASNTL